MTKRKAPKKRNPMVAVLKTFKPKVIKDKRTKVKHKKKPDEEP